MFSFFLAPLPALTDTADCAILSGPLGQFQILFQIGRTSMNAAVLTLFAQARETGGSAGPLIGLVLYLAIIVLVIVAMWRVLEKAGRPGWGILIPIYNAYLILKVAGRPGWWLILAIIPFVNLILLVIPFDIAKNFGKGMGFGFGLLFLGFIFYPILAFSDARYQPAAG
jgi:hypothetical protein